MKQALADAKAKTESAVSQVGAAVEEKLPETGNMKLDVTPSVEESKRADVELITIGGGRPNVIQIVNYDPATTARSFPVVLLHGTTTVSSVSALAGSSVDCDMYFQATSASPIAITPPGGSVKVTFGSMNEDNALSATLGSAQLVDSADKPVQVRGGQVLAVVRGGEDQ